MSEVKRWRAEKGGAYYAIVRTWNFKEEITCFYEHLDDEGIHKDDHEYNSGNYFKTEAEAQRALAGLKDYFDSCRDKE